MAIERTESDDRYQQMGRLASLWMHSQPVVGSFIRGMVADLHEVDDVVQRVAETCARKFNEFDSAGDSQSFRAWALSIARFEVLRFYQRQKRVAQAFSPEVMEVVIAEFERCDDRPDERLDALRTCLDRVTDRNRQLIEMKYFRELTTERIADRLGLTSSGVRVALSRTRQFLAGCIQEQLRKHPA